MQPVEALQRLRRQLTRAEFEKKYPHPWLLRELEDAEQSAMFRTMVSVKRAPTVTRKPVAGAPLLASLAADPGRFGLYAVAKSGSNPWADRVLVGRASNNDIVLRNDRISKLHAYFQMSARGVWRVFDAKSANGTRVDGDLVPAGEEGSEVKIGQSVTFGTLSCELVSSGDLYDAL